MKRLLMLLMVLSACVLGTKTHAGFFGHHRTQHACGKPEGSCCEVGNACCKPVVKRVAVKKKVFDVECKKICVPRVVLPWNRPGGLFGKRKSKLCRGKCTQGCTGQGGCSNCCENGCPQPPNCADVRAVRVLTSKTVEDGEKCVYEWKVEDNGGCGKSCTSCAPVENGCAPTYQFPRQQAPRTEPKHLPPTPPAPPAPKVPKVTTLGLGLGLR